MHLAEVDYGKAVTWLEQHFTLGPVAASTTATAARHTSSLAGGHRPLRLPVPCDPLAGPCAAVSHRAPSSGRRAAGAARGIRQTVRGPSRQCGLSLGGGKSPPAGRRRTAWHRDRASGGGWPPDAEGPRLLLDRRSQVRRTIVLCESAIDAISCFQLHPERICISTSGVRANPPWLAGLIARGYHIHCGFDADATGRRRRAPDDHPPSHGTTTPATRPRLERRPGLPLTSPSRHSPDRLTTRKDFTAQRPALRRQNRLLGRRNERPAVYPLGPQSSPAVVRRLTLAEHKWITLSECQRTCSHRQQTLVRAGASRAGSSGRNSSASASW